MRQRTRVPADVRFFAKVDKTETCWNWLGGTNGKGGYGIFRYNDRQGYVHRFSYELHVGPIPDGLVIDHLCRNRRCVRPDHLEAVTNQTNILRGIGPALRRASKHTQTHCSNGHEFAPETTYIEPKSQVRVCRICLRAKRRSENGWRVVKQRERRHARKRADEQTRGLPSEECT